MVLTEAFIKNHITHWENELRKPYYPHRVRWPSRLFHHAPLENAIRILKDGNLRSRQDPQNARPKDVAASGVIDTRPDAHNFARLYFRPRTPTQWHIEGIRKDGECKYGNGAHAPVLIMMVFDALSVLCREGISFSDRNMQLAAASVWSDEAKFSEIPFDKVYSEGGTGGDRSITGHRCAEVLAASPLPLEATLQWICCRTAAERDTLLYLLGPDGSNWAKKILISDDIRVFNREYTFVEEVSLSTKGLIFQLSPRIDGKKISVATKVWDSNGQKVLDFKHSDMDAVPKESKKWRAEASLSNGSYLVQIDLEDHLAFRSIVSLGDSLI